MRLITRISLGALALAGLATPADAGGPFRRPARYAAPVPTQARVAAPGTVARPEDQVARTGMLGSFTPANYIFVRGNGVVGGGYSPLGSFGQTSMDIYGPISALRQTSAPVVQYSRGYDGRLIGSEATSYSNPFLPGLSPVVYPTRASNFGALRGSGIPPQTGSGINWVDQN
ncbi:hypothetical protein TA3x_003497 [Tundrisphaera sp. TA3]|uniref:hypothetical protein n=1 Tax=Tundrisphaera sp. TA3 TaxID=3435775 RepID=UPI003EBF3B3F